MNMDHWDNDILPINDWISFAEKNTGRKKKKPEAESEQEAWNNLAENISSNTLFFSKENSDQFNEEFYRRFAGRKYTDVSFGIEVTAVLTFADAQKLDQDDESFAKFLQKYIKEIKTVIER